MAEIQGLGPGKNAAARLPVTAMTPLSHGTGRQRDDGNLPSGNNSATNAGRVFIGTQPTIQADAPPLGNAPRSTTSA